MTADVPVGLLTQPGWGTSWDEWLERLPALVAGLLDDWELTPEGPSMHGKCALVVPVREASGRVAVLKVAWPHDEGEHEALMLSMLGGDGMPRLYRADPGRTALLMERLDASRDLSSVPVHEACEIVAGFYDRLHRPASPRFRTLSSYVTRWTLEIAALDRDAPIPRRLVEQALSEASALVVDDRADAVIIHGDLHYANVLAADREPWLAIDPKPMAGDAHFEPAPLLFARWREALDTGNASRETRRRLQTIVDAASLDEDRAKAWALFRMVRSAARVAAQPHPFSAADRDYVTRCITIAKAMSD